MPPLAAPNLACLEMEAAQEHGKAIDEWLRIPLERRAQMIAYHIIKAQRASYNYERERKYAETDKDKSSSAGFNPIAAQKSRWKI